MQTELQGLMAEMENLWWFSAQALFYIFSIKSKFPSCWNLFFYVLLFFLL